MSPDQLREMADYDVVERSAQAMRAVPRGVYEDNARRALWEPERDLDSESGDVAFPDVDVLVLWFDMTIADCVWAVKVLHDAQAEQRSREDSKARNVKFVCLEGLNHFVSKITLHSSVSLISAHFSLVYEYR